MNSMKSIQKYRLGMCVTPSSDVLVTSELPEEAKKSGLFSFLGNKKLVKKILPQTLMMFFILFNYTILRDTKDVLVVTAPKSGAEIIPFLKTYVQLPAAIAFTFLYSVLSNRMPQEKVFKAVITTFLAFFGSFAAFIYPNRGLLHPNVWADKVSLTAPTFLLPVIAIIR
jgi:ATP:ADP antiporter, AAA family